MNLRGLRPALDGVRALVSRPGAEVMASYLSLAASLQPGAMYEIHRTNARRGARFAELDGEYFTSSVTNEGEDLTAYTRFTGTWVPQDGQWVCLTHHGTLYQP